MATLCIFVVFVFNLWMCKELPFNKYYFNLFIPFISGMDFQFLLTSFSCFSILTLVEFFSKKKLLIILYRIKMNVKISDPRVLGEVEIKLMMSSTDKTREEIKKEHQGFLVCF
jgi:hypothetical protein